MAWTQPTPTIPFRGCFRCCTNWARPQFDGATYTYDPAGNRKTRIDKRLNSPLTYGYDNIYQLLSAKQGSATKETYTYDIVGNRLSSLGVSPYSYNSSNELTALPSGSYSYDNNGNTKTKPDGTQYTWNIENELTQVVLPGTGGTVNFKYDPFGRRIQKAFTQSGTTTTTNYVYDGADVLETLDNSGNLISRYTQGQGIDQPLSELVSGTSSYYEQDGLGSVSSLSNAAGTLANTYTYDSYGKLTSSAGTLANPFQYTGREFDNEIGTYFYRARYYDQSSGRFLSEDPLRFGIGPSARSRRSGVRYHLMTFSALRGQSADFYPYVSNDSTNRTDPWGLWQVTLGGGWGPGGLLTFGKNNGQWNIGLDLGGAAGGFFSIDPSNEDCGCGYNAHAEGDLGIIGVDSIGGSLNVNQNGETSGSISLADPVTPNMQWSLDPSDPATAAHPALGVGAGIFSGFGYTWCF